MKEKPILFKPSMVKAIRNCKPGVWPAEPLDLALPWKWQTRRVMKPQPSCPSLRFYADGRKWFDGNGTYLQFPYGELDHQKLWIRETWTAFAHEHTRPSEIPIGYNIHYKADELNCDHGVTYVWRPSIFMPRWASREDLIIKAVRVERVQDISEEDSLAESCMLPTYSPEAEKLGLCAPSANTWTRKADFAMLWNSINNKAKRAKRNPYTLEPEDCYVCYPWHGVPARQQHRDLPLYVIPNPWVWTVEFMRLAK